MIDVRLMDSDTPTSSSAGSDMEDNEVGFVLAANIMFYLIIFFSTEDIVCQSCIKSQVLWYF